MNDFFSVFFFFFFFFFPHILLIRSNLSGFHKVTTYLEMSLELSIQSSSFQYFIE